MELEICFDCVHVQMSKASDGFLNILYFADGFIIITIITLLLPTNLLMMILYV